METRLASSVQMINHSALDEFTQAVRATQGEPDVVLVLASFDARQAATDGRLLQWLR